MVWRTKCCGWLVNSYYLFEMKNWPSTCQTLFIFQLLFVSETQHNISKISLDKIQHIQNSDTLHPQRWIKKGGNLWCHQQIWEVLCLCLANKISKFICAKFSLFIGIVESSFEHSWNFSIFAISGFNHSFSIGIRLFSAVMLLVVLAGLSIISNTLLEVLKDQML